MLKFVRDLALSPTHKFPACDAADQLCSQPLVWDDSMTNRSTVSLVTAYAQCPCFACFNQAASRKDPPTLTRTGPHRC